MPVVPKYSYHVRRTSIRVSRDPTSGIKHQAERVTTVSVAACGALISIPSGALSTTWSQTVRCRRVRRSPLGSKSGSATESGFVANFAQEVMKGQLPLSVGGLGGQGVELFGRSEALVSGLDHQLSFLDHVHEFDPDERVLGCVKRFEPQHGPCHPLDGSMVLFHDIVQDISPGGC